MTTVALSELLGAPVYDPSGAAGRVREVALAPQEDRTRVASLIIKTKTGNRMNRLGALFVVGTLAAASSHQPEQTSSSVMIAVVSRDAIGGLGPSARTKPGTVEVEPVALLAESGEWQAIPCKPGTGEGCKKFARDYLSKRHTYAVISAEGTGITIHTAPVTLSECFGYSGGGTYSGGHIAKSAIAASSSDLFDSAVAPKVVAPSEAARIRKALRPLVPKHLDTVEDLRIMHLQLEALDLLLVQRAYADNIDPKNFVRKYLFMVGVSSKDDSMGTNLSRALGPRLLHSRRVSEYACSHAAARPRRSGLGDSS